MFIRFLIIAIALASMRVAAVSKDSTSSAESTVLKQFESSLVIIDQKDSPYQLVQQIGEQVFQSVTVAKSLDADQSKMMKLIIEKQLMPFIDVKFAAYKILGTQLKKVTADERLMFVEAMRSHLVGTYADALNQYNGQTVQYEQQRSVEGKRSVAVKMVLNSPSQPPIDMTFKFRKNKKTGQWKAYDLVVEGISLVSSKRAELAGVLRQQGVAEVSELLMN